MSRFSLLLLVLALGLLVLALGSPLGGPVAAQNLAPDFQPELDDRAFDPTQQSFPNEAAPGSEGKAPNSADPDYGVPEAPGTATPERLPARSDPSGAAGPAAETPMAENEAAMGKSTWDETVSFLPLLVLGMLPVIVTGAGWLLFVVLTWTERWSGGTLATLRRWGKTLDDWMPDRWLGRLVGTEVHPPEVPPQAWWKAVPAGLCVGVVAAGLVLVSYRTAPLGLAVLGCLFLYSVAAGLRLVGNPPAWKWGRGLTDSLGPLLPLLGVLVWARSLDLGRDISREWLEHVERLSPFAWLAALGALLLAWLPWAVEAIFAVPPRDPVLIRIARFLDRHFPDRLIDWLLADYRGPLDAAELGIRAKNRVWERMLGVLLVSHLASWLVMPQLPPSFRWGGSLVLVAFFWSAAALRNQPFDREQSPPWLLGEMLAGWCGVMLGLVFTVAIAWSFWGIGGGLALLFVMAVLTINLAVRLPAFLERRPRLQRLSSAWSTAADRWLPDRLFAPRNLPPWLGERRPRHWLIGTSSVAILYFTILSIQDWLAERSVLPLAEVLVWSYPILLAFAESRRLQRYSCLRVFFEMWIGATAGFAGMLLVAGLSVPLGAFAHAIWINCTVAAAVSALVMFGIASFRYRRHPLYGWILEPLEILADLTVPDQMLRRLWRRDRSYVTGIASLAAWLALFLSGVYVATASYRQALRTELDEMTAGAILEAIVVVFFSYTPTNLLMLACLSSYLGVLTRRLIQESGGRRAVRQPLQTIWMTLLRGLSVYTFVISATAAFSLEAVLEADQTDYLGLAVGVSFLSFVAGQFSFSLPSLSETAEPVDGETVAKVARKARVTRNDQSAR